MSKVPAKQTRIHVVYPHPSQEIFDDNTFLMGNVQGAAGNWKLLINGQNVPVSPDGFFAWKVDLHPGLNPMKIQVFANTTRLLAEELFALHRMPPHKSVPALPLAVVPETMQPASEIWLTPNDHLILACLASINASVSITIPGLIETPIPLSPVEKTHAVPTVNGFIDTREVIFSEPHWTKQRIPVQGYYQASIPLQQYETPSKTLKNLPILLHLKQGQQHLQKQFPGLLTILSKARPAVITQNNAISRIAPDENATRLTPQKQGTGIWVDGLINHWVRARLTDDEGLYLPKTSVQFLDESTVLSAGHLDTVHITSSNSHSSDILLDVSEQTKAPIIQIEVPQSNLSRLQVRLFNLKSNCDFLRDHASHTLIQHLHCRQIGHQAVELWFDLARPISGYDYALQNGQWKLTVKTLPSRIQDIRILIDPGHGGTETGATGLNGIKEKDLNLTVSKLLETALKAEGFQTVMTRTQDTEVSLQTRQDKAVANKADIILSIHHNALPDGRDPLKHIGACTFYYQPFSKNLAESILKGLTDHSFGQFNIPNYGLFCSSLFIPRIHQALSVLIEVGFFTNPTEFERLIDPSFQKEVALRIAEAVKNYCL